MDKDQLVRNLQREKRVLIMLDIMPIIFMFLAVVAFYILSLGSPSIYTMGFVSGAYIVWFAVIIWLYICKTRLHAQNIESKVLNVEVKSPALYNLLSVDKQLLGIIPTEDHDGETVIILIGWEQVRHV